MYMSLYIHVFTSVFNHYTFCIICNNYLANTSHHLSTILTGKNIVYLQDGQTPLHIASGKGHIAVVQLLLQMCADVNISKKV